MSTEDHQFAELRHIRMITPVDASLPEFLFLAGVAQWPELLPCKLRVGGATPSAGSKEESVCEQNEFIARRTNHASVTQRLECLPSKQEVEGSSPSWRTPSPCASPPQARRVLMD